ncbi:AAA family ATPase [Patescibacteria group bacterium]|nr:AAA family ATPase [Patescibacteria group bacterium]MBU1885076.1 AAA family ATPase [Patescibacteria group bacterium]
MKLTLYTLAGLPFSGKSTLSKKIENYTNSMRISFDELWIELESQGIKDLTWEFVSKEAKKRIAHYLKQGKSVVYDDTNAKKEHRSSLKNISQQNSANFQVIYLDIDETEVIKRRKMNKTNKKRHSVNNKNFNSLIEQFEIPTSYEHTIKYEASDNFDKWAEQNLKKSSNLVHTPPQQLK